MGLLPDWISDPAVSGTFGSIVSLKWAPGRTWVTRAFSVIGSIGVTFYATPAVARFYSITQVEYAALMGFFFGACGPYIMVKVIDRVKETPWREIAELLSGRKG